MSAPPTKNGRSATRPGSRPPGRAAKGVSPVPASIPSAYRRDLSYGPAKNWNRFYAECKPLKTCPASRHTRMITEELRDTKSPLRRTLIDAGFEPDHMASSIEVTLACLWEARRWLEWEELPPTKRYKYNGHWVPDLSAVPMQCMTCEQPIEELCYVSIGPAQTIFCFKCCPVGMPKFRPDRVICAASAIEARRAETHSGSVADESAARDSEDAQPIAKTALARARGEQ